MNSSRPLFFASGPARWWAAGGVETSVVLPVILGGVCVAASAGNLLLLAVLSGELRRGKSAPAHALLLSLGSADLILALVCLPARLATYARRAWLLGGFVCKAAAWLLQGCLAAKSLTWAAVAQARYQQVATPGQALRWSRRRWAGVLSAVWGTALLLALPHLLFSRAGPVDCAFQAPRQAARFLAVFSKSYPLLAFLVPAGVAWSGFWRALRAQAGRRKPRLAQPGPPGRKATRLLLALCALFQAMWLPEGVVWLWERHSPSGQSPQPPPALRCLAELLLFLNGALSPGVFLVASEEFREGLRRAWRGADCRAAQDRDVGASPQALRDLEVAAAAEKVPPDVEHFWKDRRSAAAGEESDPVPWEHQDC